MFHLYSFLLSLGFTVMSPLFLLRRKKYASGFRQRLGHLPDFNSEGKPVVWLHCVSVGETQAARPLVKALLENFPEYKLVVSNTTLTGHNLAKEVFKNDASLVFYFPFDWKFSVRRALQTIKPDIVLLMETEIWFNFIRETARTGATIAIVNGRLSEKSAKRYKLIQQTLRRVLRLIDLVLVQTAEDAQRLLTIARRDTRIRTTGNIKFDQPLNETESDLTKEFRERFAISKDAPLIIAASTHAPEEKLLLDAFSRVQKTSNSYQPRLMLVPRHPERFEEVEQLIKETGLGWAKRSDDSLLQDISAEIILLDSIGELRAVYPLAEIVFVGGSLIPHGGQSIIEPAIEGKAIVTGFYTMNFKAVVETFSRQNALIQLEKLSDQEIPEKLAQIFSELFQNEQKRQELADNAFRVMRENRGATARTIENLRPFFEEKIAKCKPKSLKV